MAIGSPLGLPVLDFQNHRPDVVDEYEPFVLAGYALV